MHPNDKTNTHQVDTTTTQASTAPATSPTLDDFTDWLNELHCANFDALDATATDDAYRAHLDSFTRSNIAINLLAQFKVAHQASQHPDVLALVNGSAA